MRRLVIRDFTPDDAHRQSEYFQNSSEEFLRQLSMDPTKVRDVPYDVEGLRERIKTPLIHRKTHAFSIDLDGKMIGVAVLKDIQFGESCTLHGHIFDDELRRLRIGTQALVMVLDQAYSYFDLKMILAEPTVGNRAANALLESVGVKSNGTYQLPAAMLLLERTVNRYEIRKDWFYRELRPQFL